MMNIIGARLSADIIANNETRDIYLPNQTEQVSQVAIDVSVHVAEFGSLTESAKFLYNKKVYLIQIRMV